MSVIDNKVVCLEIKSGISRQRKVHALSMYV